jgi:hypothetical protein
MDPNTNQLVWKQQNTTSPTDLKSKYATITLSSYIFASQRILEKIILDHENAGIDVPDMLRKNYADIVKYVTMELWDTIGGVAALTVDARIREYAAAQDSFAWTDELHRITSLIINRAAIPTPVDPATVIGTGGGSNLKIPPPGPRAPFKMMNGFCSAFGAAMKHMRANKICKFFNCGTNGCTQRATCQFMHKCGYKGCNENHAAKDHHIDQSAWVAPPPPAQQ